MDTCFENVVHTLADFLVAVDIRPVGVLMPAAYHDDKPEEQRSVHSLVDRTVA